MLRVWLVLNLWLQGWGRTYNNHARFSWEVGPLSFGFLFLFFFFIFPLTPLDMMDDEGSIN